MENKIDMEKYLTADEKELLSLIHFHRKCYEDVRAKQGGLHPDDIAILKLMDNAEDLLRTISLQRIAEEKEKLKSVETECPECNSEKVREPLREEINEHGFLCNVFKCDNCGAEYIDGTPKSAKDQLKLFEEFMVIVKENNEHLSKAPKEAGVDPDAIMKQYEVFKIACAKEEEALEKVNAAKKERDKVIASWRDYLLVAKHGWTDKTMGES